MEGLPVELKLEISKHLTDKDITIMRQLSKNFKKLYDEGAIAGKTELFWKHKFHHRFPGEEKKEGDTTWRQAYQNRAGLPDVIKLLGTYLKDSTTSKGFSFQKIADRKYSFILDKPVIKRIFAATVMRKFPTEIKEFQSYFDNKTKDIYITVTLN